MLIARYERRVIGLCFRHLRQYEDACDLAQEVFVQVFKRLKDFEGRSSFSTWLYRVTLNACYNRYRFQQAKGRNSTRSLEGILEASERQGDTTLMMRSDDAGALKAMESQETESQVRSAIAGLSQRYRGTVERVDIEGLSYPEASEILEISVNTVRSRLSRARRILKGKIEKMRKRLGE